MRILVTGKNSYIGKSFIEWMNQYGDDNIIDTISLKNDDWKQQSFAAYDVILHVAGIAHVNAKENMKNLYYKINRDLTIEVAKKAKNDGVKQFVFLSSIIVYGKESYEETNGMITQDTVPLPDNFYGGSKLEAEQGILPLQSANFNIAILRPPMIYGKNSKGNFPKLAKIAKITPVFPNYKNQRSMLFIENLSEFIRLIIINNEKGVFFPQNKEYTNTTQLIQYISDTQHKKIHGIKFLNPFIKIASTKVTLLNKVFGNLTYERTMSDYDNFSYCILDLKNSIIKIEE